MGENKTYLKYNKEKRKKKAKKSSAYIFEFDGGQDNNNDDDDEDDELKNIFTCKQVLIHVKQVNCSCMGPLKQQRH